MPDVDGGGEDATRSRDILLSADGFRGTKTNKRGDLICTRVW